MLCTTSAIKTVSGTFGCFASIVVSIVLLLGPLAFGDVILPDAALLAALFCSSIMWRAGGSTDIAKSWTTGVRPRFGLQTAAMRRGDAIE